MTTNERVSHYTWLNENFKQFLMSLGKTEDEASWCIGCIGAHGDKCYCYRTQFAEACLPFEHGVAIYLLTYIAPWSKECREVGGDVWVAPIDWIVANKDRFLPHLPNAANKVGAY